MAATPKKRLSPTEQLRRTKEAQASGSGRGKGAGKGAHMKAQTVMPADGGPPSAAFHKTVKIGRPTTYRPEYCDVAIEFMSKGFSKTALCGHLLTTMATLQNWEILYPEFSACLKVAVVARTLYLEGGLLFTNMPAPAITARIFALKNAAPDEWRDKQRDNQGNEGVLKIIVEGGLPDRVLPMSPAEDEENSK